MCPKNRTEVIDASTKLGCGNDKYGNNQYLCLSNKEKTSLVELCFDGVMGIQKKGTPSFKIIISTLFANLTFLVKLKFLDKRTFFCRIFQINKIRFV